MSHFEKHGATYVVMGIAIVIIGAFIGMIFGLKHDSEAMVMHQEHDEFVVMQEICIAHDGWYCPDEEYHGLMACRRLSDHELFYVVQETGLELEPVE